MLSRAIAIVVVRNWLYIRSPRPPGGSQIGIKPFSDIAKRARSSVRARVLIQKN